MTSLEEEEEETTSASSSISLCDIRARVFVVWKSHPGSYNVCQPNRSPFFFFFFFSPPLSLSLLNRLESCWFFFFFLAMGWCESRSVVRITYWTEKRNREKWTEIINTNGGIFFFSSSSGGIKKKKKKSRGIENFKILPSLVSSSVYERALLGRIRKGVWLTFVLLFEFEISYLVGLTISALRCVCECAISYKCCSTFPLLQPGPEEGRVMTCEEDESFLSNSFKKWARAKHHCTAHGETNIKNRSPVFPEKRNIENFLSE